MKVHKRNDSFDDCGVKVYERKKQDSRENIEDGYSVKNYVSNIGFPILITLLATPIVTFGIAFAIFFFVISRL